MTIGEKIYELRSERNMSLRQFAQLTGLTHTTIARIESPTLGPQKVFLDTVYQICKKLNYSFEDFLIETNYLPAKQKKPESIIHSDEERVIIEQYRELNPACKKLIKDNIKMLTTTTAASEQKKKVN